MSLALRLIVCLVILAGCASSPVADSRFDGDYVGASTRARDGNACGPESEPTALSIHDGRFHYAFPIASVYSGYRTLVTINVLVRAGGKFDGASQYYTESPREWEAWYKTWVTLTGRVSENSLEADINSLNCSRHLALNRG
jgi:hypothetical protein